MRAQSPFHSLGEFGCDGSDHIRRFGVTGFSRIRRVPRTGFSRIAPCATWFYIRGKPYEQKLTRDDRSAQRPTILRSLP